MRTFIAIKISPESKLLEMVTLLKKDLKGESIKWVNENNFHLTLRFLGESTLEQVAKTEMLLENFTRDVHPFYFSIKGLGFFKNRNQPRVLFLKIENDGILKKLALELEKQIVSLGFEGDEREFKPHLTLARIKFVKNKNTFYSLVKKFADTEMQKDEVSEIIYYQSILSSGDPIYNPIRIFKLNEKN